MPVVAGRANLQLPRSASSLMRDLVAYWRLDEESGAAIDATSRGNTLTNNNATNAAGLTSRFARHYTAANTEYHSIATNSDVQTGDVAFTLCGWFYLDTKTGSRFLVSKDSAVSGQREYILVYDSGGDRFLFSVFRATDLEQSVSATTLGSPATATWYFVVAWHDPIADTISIQGNGGAADSAATGGAAQAASGAALGIGDRGNSATFLHDGRIAGVGLWKRILTADERTLLYNGGSGLTFTANGLVPALGWGGRS